MYIERCDMSKLRNAFVGFCGLVNLTGCRPDDGNHFTVEELTKPEMLQAEDIRVRWIATILNTMQGETGTNLKTASNEHGIEIGFADNLDHALGVYDPNQERVTLEIPYGLSEETFNELILTGRKVMYHELDHAVRDQSGHNITELSFEYQIDGSATTHEAIADMTAFIGMSEDAKIGAAPPLIEQFGVPESGHAIYYAPIPAPMADVILSGLGEGEYLHEMPDLIDDTFAAFFNSGRSEEYTLRYGSVIPESFLGNYRSSTSLSTVFTDYKGGRAMSFDNLDHMTEGLFPESDNLAPGLENSFAAGEFTSEAERLNVYDLIRKKRELDRPDGGPANHLTRQRSYDRGQNFFAEASVSRIVEQFEVLPHNAQIYLEFMRSCRDKDYMPDTNRDIVNAHIDVLEKYIPTLNQGVSNITGTLSGTAEIGVQLRTQLETYFIEMHSLLERSKQHRTQLYNMYGRDHRSDNLIACAQALRPPASNP